MNRPIQILALSLLLFVGLGLPAQQSDSTGPRRITLQEAVQLALKHNHVVRITQYQVEEKQHAKDVAKSSYFPLLRNDSNVFHLTDTQFIGIPAGSLGGLGSALIPPRSVLINQGALDIITSGTSLTQPLTQLLKIRSVNDVARAELGATRGKERQTENRVALQVHQLYYKVLIAQLHRSATEARIEAAQDLQTERVQQVKYGSVLEENLIESRAQLLQAKQDLLTTDLQLSDLSLQFNDALGLPLKTRLVLDPNVPAVQNTCQREECVTMALESHPELVEARQMVEKASAAVRLAKREYVPDVEAFARYSYSQNVPFLARNFGTFGLHFGYDLFDGGRKRSLLREREAQLEQAKENLARVTEEIELGVQTAYNKLDRTQQMVKVSEELLALRTESSRVSAQQLARGAALRSQANSAVAQELDAKTLLLQSQLDYIQSRDELVEAMGQTPQ